MRRALFLWLIAVVIGVGCISPMCEVECGLNRAVRVEPPTPEPAGGHHHHCSTPSSPSRHEPVGPHQHGCRSQDHAVLGVALSDRPAPEWVGLADLLMPKVLCTVRTASSEERFYPPGPPALTPTQASAVILRV